MTEPIERDKYASLTGQKSVSPSSLIVYKVVLCKPIA